MPAKRPRWCPTSWWRGRYAASICRPRRRCTSQTRLTAPCARCDGPACPIPRGRRSPTRRARRLARRSKRSRITKCAGPCAGSRHGGAADRQERMAMDREAKKASNCSFLRTPPCAPKGRRHSRELSGSPRRGPQPLAAGACSARGRYWIGRLLLVEVMPLAPLGEDKARLRYWRTFGPCAWLSGRNPPSGEERRASCPETASTEGGGRHSFNVDDA